MKQRQGPRLLRLRVLSPQPSSGAGAVTAGRAELRPWESGAQGTKGDHLNMRLQLRAWAKSRRFSGPQFTKHEGKGIKISKTNVLMLELSPSKRTGVGTKYHHLPNKLMQPGISTRQQPLCAAFLKEPVSHTPPSEQEPQGTGWPQPR